MDIDKLTLAKIINSMIAGFSTLLDIDKLTRRGHGQQACRGFSTLLDIDKLTLCVRNAQRIFVLVLCWILINLHRR